VRRLPRLRREVLVDQRRERPLLSDLVFEPDPRAPRVPLDLGQQSPGFVQPRRQTLFHEPSTTLRRLFRGVQTLRAQPR
jgi:hypothetical protein